MGVPHVPHVPNTTNHVPKTPPRTPHHGGHTYGAPIGNRHWLRSPMLRVLIRKFGDKLKEIQISPEHGIHYVNLLRTDYLLRYGGAGVLEFFEWGGRITVRPVVRF